MLVLNRIGFPTSSPAYQRNSILSCVQFDDVTIADDSQLSGEYTQIAQYQGVAAFFRSMVVVSTPVLEVSCIRSGVVTPLLLYVDQRPLALAEFEMLNARQGQPFILRIFGRPCLAFSILSSASANGH